MGVDFGYEKEMEQLITTYDLSNRILVIKNPPREDVISAYGESEFLILPSQWELSVVYLALWKYIYPQLTKWRDPDTGEGKDTFQVQIDFYRERYE